MQAKKLFFPLVLVVIFSLLTACANKDDQLPPLPALEADPKRLYIAGLSSGAYLAHQIHLAYPAEVLGIASFAGGPYQCAEKGVSAALFNCMQISRGAPKAETSLKAMQVAAKEGLLGDLTQLKNSKAFVYFSEADEVINPQVSQALYESYAQLDLAALKLHTLPKAGHGLPTDNQGVACDATASPYVNACGFNAAQVSLDFLDDQPATSLSKAKAKEVNQTAELHSFGQQRFNPDIKSLASEGYYFVPESCASEKCGVLVVLHGCEQAHQAVGEDFMRLSGFLAEAEKRNLIALFPQTKKSLANPKGCWDWWGYESSLYATNKGPQLEAIRNMWLQLQTVKE